VAFGLIFDVLCCMEYRFDNASGKKQRYDIIYDGRIIKTISFTTPDVFTRSSR
jgi:hypothetical protein